MCPPSTRRVFSCRPSCTLNSLAALARHPPLHKRRDSSVPLQAWHATCTPVYVVAVPRALPQSSCRPRPAPTSMQATGLIPPTQRLARHLRHCVHSCDLSLCRAPSLKLPAVIRALRPPPHRRRDSSPPPQGWRASWPPQTTPSQALMAGPGVSAVPRLGLALVRQHIRKRAAAAQRAQRRPCPRLRLRSRLLPWFAACRERRWWCWCRRRTSCR